MGRSLVFAQLFLMTYLVLVSFWKLQQLWVQAREQVKAAREAEAIIHGHVLRESAAAFFSIRGADVDQDASRAVDSTQLLRMRPWRSRTETQEKEKGGGLFHRRSKKNVASDPADTDTKYTNPLNDAMADEDTRVCVCM